VQKLGEGNVKHGQQMDKASEKIWFTISFFYKGNKIIDRKILDPLKCLDHS
jgi:hypothetical protein